MLSINLPESMESRLRAVTADIGQSLDEYVQAVFQRDLDDMDVDRQTMEDAEDTLLIQYRLEIWEKKGRLGITLEDYVTSRGMVNVG